MYNNTRLKSYVYIMHSPGTDWVLARSVNKAFTDSTLGKVFLNADIFLNALILTYQNHSDKNSSILLTFGFKIKE